ncbi:MAG: DUF5777 family beta-barrel protein [Bacteroidales bacterium]|jgi:opacity protein-like surface antigen|nr:DUF5777 family beta-barrel protein [Bacteroidales bacterium]
MRKITLFLIVFLVSAIAFAQESDNNKVVKKETTGNFRATRLIYGRTAQTSKKGTLDFRISHRFGRFSEGFEEYFGLDTAFVRIGVDYGITENLTVGFGRTKMNKEFDLTAMYRILKQSSDNGNMPVSLTAFGGVMLNTVDIKNSDIDFSDRLSTILQIFVSKEFFNRFAVQAAPVWVYNVSSPNPDNGHHIFSVGLGGRVKIAKHMSVNVEYYPMFSGNKFEGTTSPLAVSVDFDTRGHTFQLFVGNSMAPNEHLALINTTDKWTKGQLHFGFNLVRMFNVAPQK